MYLGFISNFSKTRFLVQNSIQTLRSPSSGFATIILHNLHRANHFTMAAVYVRCRYPMEVFGTLMGTFRCSMGITVLINVGLNVIITKYDNGFNSGNWFIKSCINVGDGPWLQFMLVTILGCWLPILYIEKITNMTNKSTYIMVFSPTR